MKGIIRISAFAIFILLAQWQTVYGCSFRQTFVTLEPARNEKQIAELAQQLLEAKKEIILLRRQLHAKAEVTTLKVEHWDVGQAVENIESWYYGAGISVKVGPKSKTISIRAHSQTVQEIRKRIAAYDKYALEYAAKYPWRRFGGGFMKSSSIRLSDEMVLIAIIKGEFEPGPLSTAPDYEVLKELEFSEWEFMVEFTDPTNSFNNLLKKAKRLAPTTIEPENKKAVAHYLAVLERMAKEAKNQKNETNEIRKLIFDLRDQTEFNYFSTDDKNSPAAKLLAIGNKAIPFLIDELENDNLTRTTRTILIVTDPPTPTRPPYHVRIGDCVCGILRKITGQSFGDSYFIHERTGAMTPQQVRKQAQAWWDKHKKD